MLNYSKLFDLARDFYADLSYNRRSGKALIPLRYFFELTYRCNLNCPYCYVRGASGESGLLEFSPQATRQKVELTLLEWKDVIAQVPRYSFVTLVGGEPLLRQDFKDILFATSKRVFGKLNVVTNGILLNDDTIDALISSKAMLLSVSLDGWGEAHDKNRGAIGIFEKITKNLERLNEKRRGSRLMVDIKTIVLKDNLDDLPKLYKYCCEQGFEFFSMSFLRNNDLKQNSVLREDFGPEFYEQDYPIEPYFDLEHFEKVWEQIEEIRSCAQKPPQIRTSPKFEGGCELSKIKRFFTSTRELHPKDIYNPCKYPYSNMMINPQGDVYPCLSVKMGNVKESKLKDVFNVPKFRCFRKNLRHSGAFSSCQMCCELTPKLHKTEI